ncbi:MAG: hypothetical protein ACI9NN_000314 [Bacteroidia bacterium]|jgi:hypothetical protein
MIFIDNILNPTVFLGDFEWREPVTTLTDFLVALVCWFAVYSFVKAPKNQRVRPYHTIFIFYFLSFAIGMTSAAWFGHGLQAYVSPRFKIIGWCFGATGLMLLQQGSFYLVEGCVQRAWMRSAIRAAFVVQWFTFLVLAIHPSTSQFMVAQINSTLAIIGTILPMHLINYRTNNDARSRLVLGAIAFSLIPGVVYSQQLSFGRWCNYHDISHILMATFMFFMFRALKTFGWVDAN